MQGAPLRRLVAAVRDAAVRRADWLGRALLLALLFGGLALVPADGVDGWIVAADAHAAAGEYTLALQLYEGAARQGRYGGGLAVRLGLVHLVRQRYTQAETVLSRGLADCLAAGDLPLLVRAPLSDCVSAARAALGQVYARTSRPRAAAQSLASAAALGRSDAHYPLALVLLRLGQEGAAHTELEALASDGHEQAQLGLALLDGLVQPDAVWGLLTRLGQRGTTAMAASARQAAADLAAIGAEPDAAYRAMLIGRSALRADQPEVALAAFREAARLNASFAQAHAYQAYAFYLLGDLDLAMDATRDALALDAHDSQAHYVRGLVLRRLGRPAEAVLELEQALVGDPGNPALLGDLGETYAELRNYDQAQEDLSAAVRADPTSAVPWMRLARYHLGTLLQVGSGLEAAENAARLSPGSAEALGLLGWGLYLNGRPADALPVLRRAVSVDPRSAEAQYHLGIVEAEVGTTAGARRAFQRAVDLDIAGYFEARALAALASLP